MAKVLVVLKVTPENIEIDLDKIVEAVKQKMPETYELLRYEKVPVAFGLYFLRLYIAIPEEEEGGTEKLEKVIKGIEGVSEIEVELLHRLGF